MTSLVYCSWVSPVVLLVMVSGCSPRALNVTKADNDCLTNLAKLHIRLQNYGMDHGETFPTGIAALGSADAKSNLGRYLEEMGKDKAMQVFVCPASGHESGSQTNIGQWTDYIYCGNGFEVSAQVPLIVCPPENHAKKFGHVLWQNGQISRLDCNLTWLIITNPWAMETNAWLTGSVKVQIPDRLRAIYTNAVDSRTSETIRALPHEK
jgi:hypothetical protein